MKVLEKCRIRRGGGEGGAERKHGKANRGKNNVNMGVTLVVG